MNRTNNKSGSNIKLKTRKLIDKGDFKSAVPLLKKIIKKDRYDVDSINVLATVYTRLNQWQEASRCYKQVLKLNPAYPNARMSFASALSQESKFEDAISQLTRLHTERPADFQSTSMLAQLYLSAGQFDLANEQYDALLSTNPGDDRLIEIADIKYVMGQLTRAAEIYSDILQRKENSEVYDKLGICYCGLGEIEKSVEAHRRAIATDPKNKKAFSNYLLSLHYLSSIDNNELLEAHKEYVTNFTPKDESDVRDNSKDDSGIVSVGFVSADLRTHSVAYFMEALLKIDPALGIEASIFSDVARPDDTSERFKRLVTHWHDIAALGDEDAYQLIRKSDIDILIDLAGHSSKNRLSIFARRAAPIQMTYLGYPDTTAIPAMDYRIVDNVTDPIDAESYCTEKLLRLPDCFLCYTPFENSPDINELPALDNGHITFGSFNNLSKINDSVIDCWGNVLEEVDDSRLLIKNPSLTDPDICDRLVQQFTSKGIDTSRVILQGRTQSVKEHLEQYHKIDIALDTFPYNGTTTTCEALWMGIPVITLKGDSHMSRVSASLLSSTHLDKLVAESNEGFVRIASLMASDISALSETRKNMRGDLSRSKLFDQDAFSKQFYTKLKSVLN